MTQLLIFLALAISIDILMRKKLHKPNKNFYPNQLVGHLEKSQQEKEPERENKE